MATNNKITVLLLRVQDLTDPRLQNLLAGEHFIHIGEQAIYWKDPADDSFKPLSAVPVGKLVLSIETHSTNENGKTILVSTYTYADGSTEEKTTDLGDLRGQEGRRGEQGLTGEKGDPGPQGVPGLPGKDGDRGLEIVARPSRMTMQGRIAICEFDLEVEADVFLIDSSVMPAMGATDAFELRFKNVPDRSTNIARSIVVMFQTGIDLSGYPIAWKVQRSGTYGEFMKWHHDTAPLLSTDDAFGFLLSNVGPFAYGIYLGSFTPAPVPV